MASYTVVFQLQIITRCCNVHRVRKESMGIEVITHLNQHIWPTTMRDVALQIRRRFAPDFDDVDFKFIANGKRLNLQFHCLFSDTGLVAGDVLRIHILQRQRLRLAVPCNSWFCPCNRSACKGRVWGRHFILNTETLAPAHLIGQRTLFSEITSSLRYPDLINSVCMDTKEIADLKMMSSNEWLWNCNYCDKFAYVRTAECIPVDPDVCRRWDDNGRYVYCGECLDAGYDR